MSVGLEVCKQNQKIELFSLLKLCLSSPVRFLLDEVLLRSINHFFFLKFVTLLSVCNDCVNDFSCLSGGQTQDIQETLNLVMGISLFFSP